MRQDARLSPKTHEASREFQSPPTCLGSELCKVFFVILKYKNVVVPSVCHPTVRITFCSQKTLCNSVHIF